MILVNKITIGSEFFFSTRVVGRAARRSVGALLLMLYVTSLRAQKIHLSRSVEDVAVVNTKIPTESAHYQPIFGVGDRDSSIVKGVKRFGYLSVDPEGKSNIVNYGREELVYYVLEGEGVIHYAGQDYPIMKEDFFYLPIDTEHGFANDRKSPLKMMVMGFPVPPGVAVEPTDGLKLANADDVSFQVLAQGHGPTSRYKLLLGSTDSERDRLSLFIINKNDQPENIELAFSDFEVDPGYTVNTYTGEGPHDESPELTTVVPDELLSNQLPLQLPPVSLSIIQLTRKSQKL